MADNHRRLAAILVGDIVGYTAQMAMDEAAALAHIVAMRNRARPIVERHEGRWIKNLGDGFLASFHSAVEAVRCAVELQTELVQETDYALRLGIHLGDVIFTADDVYGDGVNAAARLELLAPAGGICVSSQVWELVRNQPDLTGRRLGPTNIPPGDIVAWGLAGPGMPPPAPGPAQARLAMDGRTRDKVEVVGFRLWRWLPALAAGGAGVLLGLAIAAALGGPETGEALRGLFGGAGSVEETVVPAGPDRLLLLPAANPEAASDEATALASVLAQALHEDEALALVPESRREELLAQMGDEVLAGPDAQVARGLALRDGALRGVLLAESAPVGAATKLSVRLLDPESGETRGSWQEDAQDEAALLPAMRRLGGRVAAALPAALAPLPTPDPAAVSLAHVSTASDAALRHYGAGLAASQREDWALARVHAERAVEADPAFALAHLLAGASERMLGMDPGPEDHLVKAGVLDGGLSDEVERELLRAGTLRARGGLPRGGGRP